MVLDTARVRSDVTYTDVPRNHLLDCLELAMPKVLNHYKGASPDSVYIWRPSKWGNPWVISEDYDRQRCVNLHRQWVLSQPALIEQIKAELRGKDLVCFCAPKACHGDVLLEIANS